MFPSGKRAHEIDAEAAGWAARVDSAPLPVDEEQALENWLGSDVRCAGAFGRMRAVALATERARALGPDFKPDNFGPDNFKYGNFQSGDFAPAPSRRLVLQVGGAIAATVTVAAMGGWQVLRHHGRYQTGKGEMKVVALKDGSVVTLNTDSEIAVTYSDALRGVELVRGEALFDVAKNRARPFIVAAGDTSVRVVGTSFTVRRLDAAPLQVLVREGTVEVFKPQMIDAHPVRISANTRAVATAETPDIAARAVPLAELHRELAWQDGHIAFEGQTLQQAAAEFARYSDTRIVIDDPMLAHEEIAGLFRSNDPVGFAQTIAISLNVHARVGEGEVRLTR